MFSLSFFRLAFLTSFFCICFVSFILFPFILLIFQRKCFNEVLQNHLTHGLLIIHSILHFST